LAEAILPRPNALAPARLRTDRHNTPDDPVVKAVQMERQAGAVAMSLESEHYRSKMDGDALAGGETLPAGP